MTTRVYCKKEIDIYGDYKDYRCPKIIDADDCQDICERCIYYIPEGEEVPYTL